MAITTLAQLQTARQQSVTITRIAEGLAANGLWLSSFANLGEPSGTLAGTNTANGIVPTSSDAGYPRIAKFASGNTGYIKTLRASLSGVGNAVLFDRLFVAGAYPFNASTTLTSQPSFASRVPNADYTGLEIWIETIAFFNGTATITIGYTNQNGVNSRVSTVTVPAIGGGVCAPLPLQAGDSGIQSINSVACSGVSAGTFNVMVLRRLHDFVLWQARGIDMATMFDGFVLEQIYDTSALYILSNTPSTSSGLPRIQVQIAEG